MRRGTWAGLQSMMCASLSNACMNSRSYAARTANTTAAQVDSVHMTAYLTGTISIHMAGDVMTIGTAQMGNGRKGGKYDD